jgi:hypothetical protein
MVRGPNTIVGMPIISALALLALGACQAQATSEYLGQPLITLNGQIVSSGALPPLEAAMLWQQGPPPTADDLELATLAPVQTGFPATFTLHLYLPPPEAARLHFANHEARYARANAAAVPFGIASTQLSDLPSSGNPSYGIDPSHWVLWLEDDVAAGSITEWWLGAALKKGFHLVDVAAFNSQCQTPAALSSCAAELVSRGAIDDGTDNPGTARAYCLAPYRLSVAYPSEGLVLQLGAVATGVGGLGNCRQ